MSFTKAQQKKIDEFDALIEGHIKKGDKVKAEKAKKEKENFISQIEAGKKNKNALALAGEIKFDKKAFTEKRKAEKEKVSDEESVAISLINSGLVEFYNDHVSKGARDRAKNSLTHNQFLDFCDTIGQVPPATIAEFVNRKKRFNQQPKSFILKFKAFANTKIEDMTPQDKQKAIAHIVKRALRINFGIDKGNRYYPSKVTIAHLSCVTPIQCVKMGLNPEWRLTDFSLPQINNLYELLVNPKGKK